jgi:hypothetical protein
MVDPKLYPGTREKGLVNSFRPLGRVQPERFGPQVTDSLPNWFELRGKPDSPVLLASADQLFVERK